MFWSRKTLDERLEDALKEYSTKRYLHRVDMEPIGSQAALSASSRLSDVKRAIAAGAPVRETLVNNFSGILLTALLKAANERRPSRQERGDREWDTVKGFWLQG